MTPNPDQEDPTTMMTPTEDRRVEQLRARMHQGDRRAREELAQILTQHVRPIVCATWSNNNRFELRDLEQEAAVYVLRALDDDKGLGSISAFVQWRVRNRIKDHMASQLRKTAVMYCTCCGAEVALESVKHRECKKCGARGDKIVSTERFRSLVLESDDPPTSYDTTEIEVEQFLEGCTEVERRIVWMMREGFSQKRIAQSIGMEVRRVRNIEREIKRRALAQLVET